MREYADLERRKYIYQIFSKEYAINIVIEIKPGSSQ